MRWLTRAADKGDSQPMVLLGLMYKDGLGVEVDREKARSWLVKAAHAGEDVAYGLLQEMKRESAP